MIHMISGFNVTQLYIVGLILHFLLMFLKHFLIMGVKVHAYTAWNTLERLFLDHDASTMMDLKHKFQSFTKGDLKVEDCLQQLHLLACSFITVGNSVSYLMISYSNSSRTDISQNPVFHSRTTHIALHYHFVYAKIALDNLQVSDIPIIQQLVDIRAKNFQLINFMNLL